MMTTEIENIDVINSMTIVYEADAKPSTVHPEFKPGSTPQCWLGDELLNGKVNWLITLGEILATGQFTISMIAKQIGIHAKGVALILENDLRFLTFHAGATLLAIHESTVVAARMMAEEK